tara:strand:+ start:72 stop:356 length:285 start_codon:yes stop_codon:yes gene_type:complete
MAKGRHPRADAMKKAAQLRKMTQDNSTNTREVAIENAISEALSMDNPMPELTMIQKMLERLRTEYNKDREKRFGAKDFRKGGYVTSTVDNRKKK